MSLTEIPFGGMRSLEADERVPLERALVAQDCYLDDDTIRGRNGYRSLTASALAGSGAGQGVWRYRHGPAAANARLVAAVAGEIFTVTDPSSETASDGSAASAGTPFGASALLSAAQLGKHLYLGTDEANVSWRRMKTDWTLEDLKTLPQGAKPTATTSSLAWVVFRTAGLTVTDGSGVTHANSGLNTTWIDVTPTGADQTLTVDLPASQDWRGVQWLLVGVTPHDGGNTAISIQIGNATPLWQEVGQIYDTPQAGGSENVIFCDLTGLQDAIKSAPTKIRFTNLRTNSSWTYGVYGYALLPLPPFSNPQKYYTSFYDSSSQQESPLTEALEVTIDTGSASLPYQDYWMDRDAFKSGGQQDPFSSTNLRVFNRGAGKAMPGRGDLGLVVTVRQTLPGSPIVAGHVARLWKDTRNGRRLVTTKTLVSGDITNGYVDLVDTGSDNVLTAQKYKAGGTPPRANALCARAGRLVAGYENRVYISSFVTPDQNSDPFPQFPAIAIDDIDGWSFDIAASKSEQILALVGDPADAVYILTNEACRVMEDLRPNAKPYHVLKRGALGRRAACFAEDQLFYASWDGLYAVRNRADWTELSQEIRRHWVEWFAPSSACVVGYQGRKLYVVSGQKGLRFDFVKERWTRLTLSHTFEHGVAWRDPSGTVENLWFMGSDRKVYRWQPGSVVGSANAATTDAGTAIPAWVYATGYAATSEKASVRSLLLEATSAVQVSVLKDSEDSTSRVKTVRAGERQVPFFADVTGYALRLRLVGPGGAQLRSLAWERRGVDADGS